MTMGPTTVDTFICYYLCALNRKQQDSQQITRNIIKINQLCRNIRNSIGFFQFVWHRNRIFIA